MTNVYCCEVFWNRWDILSRGLQTELPGVFLQLSVQGNRSISPRPKAPCDGFCASEEGLAWFAPCCCGSVLQHAVVEAAKNFLILQNWMHQ